MTYIQDDDDSMFGGFDFEGMDSMFAGSFAFAENSHSSRQGQSCKTMTQKIGNVVTTYTQCS